MHLGFTSDPAPDKQPQRHPQTKGDITKYEHLRQGALRALANTTRMEIDRHLPLPRPSACAASGKTRTSAVAAQVDIHTGLDQKLRGGQKQITAPGCLKKPSEQERDAEASRWFLHESTKER